MHDYEGGWGTGQWLGMSVMMLLLMAALIALIVWAVRSSGRNGMSPAAGGPTPLEVLAARFARGEIDATEYERSRDLLRSATRHAE